LDDSAILSLAWHPSGRLLAVSTLLGNYHIVTAALKSDTTLKEISWVQSADLGTFDKNIGTVKHGSWIHSLTFSPSGDHLALAAHDGNAYIIDLGNQQTHSIPSSQGLPLRHVRFISERCAVVAGFDTKASIVIKSSEGTWKLEGNLNSISGMAIGKGNAGAVASPDKNNTASNSGTRAAFGGALAKFKSMDQQGLKDGGDISSMPPSGGGTNLSTISTTAVSNNIHQGSISDMRLHPTSEANGEIRLTTTGNDGRLVEWDLKMLLVRAQVANI
jgi:actin related protein 2/3 complex subunit 1A/1B